MTDKKEYKISVDTRILELLGPNLYTNIYYVLAELIANAYDASAHNVYIISKDNEIIVEDDGNGGTRTTEQESQGDTVVMSSNGSSSDPFITKVYNPAVTGVIITAEGATSSKVKYEIQLAVSKLYDIGLDKVNVYPSKN